MGVGSDARRMLGALGPGDSAMPVATHPKVLDIRSRRAYTHGNVRPSWVPSDAPTTQDTALSDWSNQRNRTPRQEEHSVHIERRAQTWMLALLITISTCYGSWLGVEVVTMIRDNQSHTDQIQAVSLKVSEGQARIYEMLNNMGVRIDKIDYRLRRVEKNPTKKYDDDDNNPSTN